MATHEIVYVGGPRHGEREARQGDVFESPNLISLPTFNGRDMKNGTTFYERNPAADTPGAIAYVYKGVKWE